MSVSKVSYIPVASSASSKIEEGGVYCQARMYPLRTDSSLMSIQRTAQQGSWISGWAHQLYNMLSSLVIKIRSWFMPASAYNTTLSQTQSTPTLSSVRNMHNLQEFKKALVPEVSAIRIFELFDRLSVEDQSEICRNIWEMEGGATIASSHPINRENNYGKAFFKANPHHRVVLAAVRAVVVSRDYEAQMKNARNR